MPFRAFVGVPLHPEESLLRARKTIVDSGADVRLPPPDHLHLTLAFLGDVPDDATPALAAALDAAVAGVAPMHLLLHGTGAFPNVANARVVWAGVADAAPLVALANKTRAALAAAGFPGDDKPFRAHVTLGRVRSPRGARALEEAIRSSSHRDLGALDVDAIHLYKSTMSPHGSTYEILHTALLGGN